VLEAYSVSHGKASAWLPVLELLADILTFSKQTTRQPGDEKVRAALAALDPALADTESYLFGLLAIADSPDPLVQMDPKIKRERTTDALKRIVLRESVKQAVVIKSLFAEQLEDHLSELAHHYSHSENVNKAVEYLGRAG
jgi:hypothetical protein